MTTPKIGEVRELPGRGLYRLVLLQTVRGRGVAWAHLLRKGEPWGGREFLLKEWLGLRKVETIALALAESLR